MGLMDRLFAPVRECVSFPDLLIGLSGINNEPLSDVIYYLSCCDLELLKAYRIGMSHKVELIENSQDLIHYFLEDVSVSLPIAAKTWVFTGHADSLRLLPADTARELIGIFDAHVDSYFKISELLSFAPLEGYLGFLESDTVSKEVASSQGNNSLASYMTEYTLPQVVAIILHIDLADITTSSNNSYIHEQSKYDESIYSKFNNLLQSYSVAALNNKIDGADVHTRLVVPYGGGQEIHANLEKTTISKDRLASYLDSIGYQLDDLIAKQEQVHIQHNSYQGSEDEAETVLLLRQQVEDLQAQLTAAESTENSLVIEGEPASIELGKYQKLLMGYPLLTAHQIACLLSNHNPVSQDYYNDDSYKLYKEMTDTAIDGRLLTVFNEKGHIAIEEVKVWLASNNTIYKGFNEDWLENACEEEEDILVKMNNQFNDIVHYLREINEKKEEDIEQLASEYEELRLECEELVKQNKDIRESLEQYKQGDNEELAQHGEDESKKYKSRIEEPEDQLKKAQDDSKDVPHQSYRTVDRIMYAMAKLSNLDNIEPYSQNNPSLNASITTILQNDGLTLEYQAVGRWLTRINNVKSLTSKPIITPEKLKATEDLKSNI